MGLPFKTVQNTQIALQLSKIGCLKFSGFQFNCHKAIQRAVEEQQINILILAECVQMVLISNESKILSKGQDLCELSHNFLNQVYL